MGSHSVQPIIRERRNIDGLPRRSEAIRENPKLQSLPPRPQSWSDSVRTEKSYWPITPSTLPCLVEPLVFNLGIPGKNFFRGNANHFAIPPNGNRYSMQPMFSQGFGNGFSKSFFSPIGKRNMSALPIFTHLFSPCFSIRLRHTDCGIPREGSGRRHALSYSHEEVEGNKCQFSTTSRSLRESRINGNVGCPNPTELTWKTLPDSLRKINPECWLS